MKQRVMERLEDGEEPLVLLAGASNFVSPGVWAAYEPIFVALNSYKGEEN